MPPHPGTLHLYAPNLVAFEFSPFSPSPSLPPPLHTLLFIPGLSDGLLTVPYLAALNRALPPNWRLIQPLLSSSYGGWGTLSLDNDVREIAQCIAYFSNLDPQTSNVQEEQKHNDGERAAAGKTVVMGHSTGCQDIVHYLLSPSSPFPSQFPSKPPPAPHPPLNAIILQAPISDREALHHKLGPDTYTTLVSHAQSLVSPPHLHPGPHILPPSLTSPVFPSPVSATRFLSLASPGPAHAGMDDYFSSDFGDERVRAIWGRVGGRLEGPKRVLVLYGAEDEFVPAWVDKEGLVRRWERELERGGAVVDGESGVVEGAVHNLGDGEGEVVREVVGRVRRFLERVEDGR